MGWTNAPPSLKREDHRGPFPTAILQQILNIPSSFYLKTATATLQQTIAWNVGGEKRRSMMNINVQ